MVWAGRALGQIYNWMDQPKDALEILSASLAIAQRNNFEDEEKRILNNIGIAYTFLAEYHKALDVYFKTLVLREKDGDLKEISAALNNVGLTYFKLRNYPKALEFYQLALNKQIESKDSSFIDLQYANIGLCYNQLKQYKEATESLNKALEICKPNCSDRTIVTAKFGLGVTNLGLQRFAEAENAFLESLEASRRSANHRYEAENNVYLAKLKIAQQRYTEAVPFLQQAENIAQQYGFKELLIDTYRQYSILYTEMQDHKMASSFQQKYIHLKDSVYSEELIERIAQIQTDFAERENLATIRAKEEIIRRQRMLNLLIGIIALLAAALLFILFRSNIVVKKVNQALSKAKQELEDLNRDLDKKVKEKTASLEKVNREMEHFIYKTSHDIRGPLATLKGVTGVALIDVKDPKAIEYFQRLDATATKLNRVLSRLLIINQVNQAILSVEPLNVSEMVDEIIAQESRNGLPPRMKIIKEISPNLVFHSDRQLLGIILANLIDNAIKYHSNSQRLEPFVRITAELKNSELHIHVVDNGLGVNESDREKIFQLFYRGNEKSETGGVGLYLCRLATERLQGKIGVSTTGTEHYTDFYVVLPVMKDAEVTA
ncbi:MAG: tetratricopeptide repeat-containing sensor histidine kinase [Cyclobacteriaceae bacterium]|nr:tetratricopeptide repeat-containing sensor histidine kinase [Cyclobacteriaceae bacterium]